MKHGRMYCIYCYTNKITGKKYIGQTCQTLEERAGKDGYRYHANHVFGAAIKKYGWENFVGEVLEDGLTLEQANEREQYWISKLNTLAPCGYNLAKGGNNHVAHEITKKKMSLAHMGHLVTDETKQKMSDAFKGKVPLQMTQTHYKRVQQYTLDGQFIREFDSIKQAEEETKTCHGKISLVCLGKRKSAGGYYWKQVV